MYQIDNNTSSYFDLLPVEVQQQIFKRLTFKELTNIACLISKQWQAVAEAMITPRYIIASPQLSRDVGWPTRKFIRAEWKKFVTFVDEKKFSNKRRACILDHTKTLIEIEITELHQIYQKSESYPNIPFEQWLTTCYLNNNEPPPTLFTVLLTIPSVSCALNLELKDLFLSFAETKSQQICNAISFDHVTKEGDPKLLKYLIKNKSEFLDGDNSAILAALCRWCRLREDLSLLKYYIRQIFKHHGLSQATENAIFVAMAEQNGKKMGFYTLSGPTIYPPPLSAREITEYIQMLKKPKKQNNGEGAVGRVTKLGKKIFRPLSFHK